MSKRTRAKIPPDLAKARNAFESCDYETAFRLAERVVVRQRANPEAHYLLGASRLASGRPNAAVRSLRQATRLRPHAAEYHAHLGSACLAARDLDGAQAAADDALAIAPGDSYGATVKAFAFMFEGRTDEAFALLEPIVERSPVDVDTAVCFARVCLAKGCPERAIQPLQNVVRSQSVPDSARSTPLFCLGDALNAIGRYDDAFEAYSEANAARPVRFSPQSHSNLIDQMIANWTHQAVRRLADSLDHAEQTRPAVFVVGMPRSGTTVVEQMLAAYPGVHAAGELLLIPGKVREFAVPLAIGDTSMLTTPAALTPTAVRRAGTEHIARLRELAPDAERIIDKLPTNFLHLGLISLMLPGATIVHCTRDPRDTCLSCFFQEFQTGQNFAFDLGHLASFYNDYRRLMDHWQSVLGVTIHEVRYERLVSDPEPVMRPVIAEMGLQWDDACLSFHETDRTTLTASFQQVRKPLYSSSVGRWRRYEKHLAPLVERLNPDLLTG